MVERARFWRSNRWRALRPDVDLAEAEGLAAGTGLLTGTVVRTAGTTPGSVAEQPCPHCGATGEVIVVDLVAHATTLRCPDCTRRWTVDV
jgi:Ribonuclease G/E